MQDFKKHLARQIGFLERSCTAFDDGFCDEAIRIATIFRVLFHDTKNQTSLLRHLQVQNIKLLDTAVPPMPITAGTIWFDGMGTFEISADGTSRYHPTLGETPNTQFIPFSDWWKQVVFIRAPEIRLTREKIVLVAAEKDGGAHIDARLTPEYNALARDGAAGWFVYRKAGIGISTAITGAHFTCLRQMGFEVCNSPELIAAAK